MKSSADSHEVKEVSTAPDDHYSPFPRLLGITSGIESLSPVTRCRPAGVRAIRALRRASRLWSSSVAWRSPGKYRAEMWRRDDAVRVQGRQRFEVAVRQSMPSLGTCHTRGSFEDCGDVRLDAVLRDRRDVYVLPVDEYLQVFCHWLFSLVVEEERGLGYAPGLFRYIVPFAQWYSGLGEVSSINSLPPTGPSSPRIRPAGRSGEDGRQAFLAALPERVLGDSSRISPSSSVIRMRALLATAPCHALELGVDEGIVFLAVGPDLISIRRG